MDILCSLTVDLILIAFRVWYTGYYVDSCL